MNHSVRGESGDSLIELLIAISILGVSGTGLIGAMLMVSSASAMHTQVGVSDSILRTWAANLDTSPYVGCARPADVAAAPEPSGWGGSAPEWTRTIDGITYDATVDRITYWDTSKTFFTSTCSTDSGLQRVTLSVSAPGAGLPGTTGRLVVTRRNPCRRTTQAGCSA